jgi:hypothetical protein
VCVYVSNSLRYNKDKPKKWGFKLFALCTVDGSVPYLEFREDSVSWWMVWEISVYHLAILLQVHALHSAVGA